MALLGLGDRNDGKWSRIISASACSTNHLVRFSRLALPSISFNLGPPWYCFGSVLLTCFGGTFIAVYAADLHWENAAWIWLYNIGAFLVVDVVKVAFKQAIGEASGDIIEGDGLVEVEESKTEAKKHIEKKLRQVVHTESVVPPSEMSHTIEVTENKQDLVSQVSQHYMEMRSISITDGFVAKKRLGKKLQFGSARRL